MDDKVKELLDRIRGAADTAAVAAAGTARAAGRRAGQMADVAKLNVQLFDLNGEFDGVLRQLGRVMYDAHQGREAGGEAVAALLAKADSTAEKIEDVKARIAALRQSQTCPVCGTPCGKEDKFCRRCGGPL